MVDKTAIWKQNFKKGKNYMLEYRKGNDDRHKTSTTISPNRSTFQTTICRKHMTLMITFSRRLEQQKDSFVVCHVHSLNKYFLNN